MRSFFDTNILVYLFDEDFPEKKAQAQALLEKETKNGKTLVSTQVLQEFYVTVTRKYDISLKSNPVFQLKSSFSLNPLALSIGIKWNRIDSSYPETASHRFRKCLPIQYL